MEKVKRNVRMAIIAQRLTDTPNHPERIRQPFWGREIDHQ